MKHLLLSTVLILGTVGFATAQQKKTPASPPAETSATIGGKAVAIKYNSPSVKGRKIFGGLVPFGQVWPKGDYTLYVIPTEKEWTLAVNKQTGQWGTEYSQANDLGRAKMTVKAAPALVEGFKITLTDKALTMEWENTTATVSVKAK
jgi:hypothetical protein